MHARRAFCVVPLRHLAELRRLEAEEPDEDDIDGVLIHCIMRNRLYLRAEEVAIHAIALRDDADIWTRDEVFSFLHRKVGAPDKPDILDPEDCPAWARAIDAYLDERGGLDWLLRDLARRNDLEQPAAYWRQDYHDLRAALDRAIADRAGLLYAIYRLDAEQELADVRAAREAERQRVAARPKMSPEEKERWAAEAEAELTELFWQGYEAHLNAPPETDPDAPTERILSRISLYTVPGAVTDRLQAMWKEYLRMLRSDDLWEQSDELALDMKHLAWDEARNFWDVRVRGHETAWQALEEVLLPRRKDGNAREQQFIYSPEDVAGLGAAVRAWEAGHGGRDAAVATIAAATIGESRAHAAQAIEQLMRLIGAACEHGHGLVRVPFEP